VARPEADTSLLGALLASAGAAIAMLFTPCVFPMIPITVSFFLKQSEQKHHNALLTAAVYSLTIIIVLALSVLILGQLIVTLANNAWLNLALGALLIFFALSLFGMYELELPSGLARFTASREGKGGYAGTVFMALTFTITSFTCTGPFLGPLLVGAKELQLSTGKLVLSSLAYSATFAAPFFVLALFPRLLKALPKSGGWLNSVKVVMGFLELAAALKFLGNMDISLNPGSPMFFNYETVLCAWIALSVACGLYLLGVFRLPHDSPVESIGVVRMLLATIFMGLALYMAPALWREKPLGVVGNGLVAFLPLDTKDKSAFNGGSVSQGHLDWHLDYEKAWKQATAENKLIFIDFTGVNCTNCRDNEQRVFPRPAVRKALEKYVRVQMYNDSVPKPGLSREQADQEAYRNREWQEKTFGDVTTPLYIVFKPAKDEPFADGKLKGTVLYQVGGSIPESNIEQFAENLQAPLANSGAIAQATGR
jgi:thiol:disulfide interchange protein DsbD